MDRPHKKKSTLSRLPVDQQDSIFEIVESGTLAKARKHLLDEYGIELSEQAISEWAMEKRFAKNLFARTQLILRARNSADEFLRKIGGHNDIDQANLALLAQAYFDAQVTGDKAAMGCISEPYTFLLDAVAKSRRADAALQDSETAMQKFRFDAAKLVLEHLEELNAIRGSDATDNEKLSRVVERVFGKPPEAKAEAAS